MDRVRIFVAIACLGLSSAAEVRADVRLEGFATARLQEGVSIIGQVGDPIALPDDGTTGVQQLQNSHLHAGGEFISALSSQAIGGYSAVLGASNSPSTNSGFSMVAGNSVTFADELTVTSATLPAGTPVTVHFRYAVSRYVTAEHSTPFPVIFNYASTSASFTTNVTSLAPYDAFVHAAVDNRHTISTLSGQNLAIGIFAGTNLLDDSVDTEVGATIQFSVVADCDAYAAVAPESSENRVGSAECSLGTAFGAEGPAEVVLESARLGGAAFPDLADASVANAAASIPPNPIAPAVPALSGGALASLAALLAAAGLVTARRMRLRGPPSPP